MNFGVYSLHLVLAALLHASALKAAHIPPKDGGKSKNEVVPFMDVYTKSQCNTREVLVDILQEYPDDIESTYIPSCVVLNRCAGCCNDEALECGPKETQTVTMEVLRVRQGFAQHKYQLNFTEHTKCECRPKQELKTKKEKCDKPRR
ncbi:vascular endothelial growth factor A-A isoform X2 [Astyanax mexicanus]|uniref:vascular endothelial growth factor A-A isoform X2 n=1 Tax=Astyanax mexicanus TaxID=7994 RepID=UPI000BBD9A51|nr:vascular endothelial growth factor A-A isoform X2 [Astyanax mexicanus]